MRNVIKVGRAWMPWIVAAAAIVAGLLWWAFSGAEPDRSVQMEKVRGEFAAKKVNGSNWIAPPSRRPKAREGIRDRESGVGDQEVHDALNDEDQGLAIELAREAVKSKRTEVRSEMVGTLKWFGDKTMPELLLFIDDPDEGVRTDAMAAYQQAIYDIEDDKDKAKVIEISMRNLNDEDALGEIASELIGMDDILAVQTLVNVIDGGGKTGRRVAKATYETVTGEEYTTFEAAEAWVRERQDE